MSGVYHGVDRVVPTSAYDQAVLAAGPEAYYPLSGNATDATGNGHDGTMHNSPTATTLPNGEGGMAFDGSSQYIDVPDHPNLSVTATGVLAVEAWMRPDIGDFAHIESTSTSLDYYIYWAGKANGIYTTPAGQNEWDCRMYSLSSYRPQRISFYAFNAPGHLGDGSYFQDPEPIGTWIHYVGIYNTINVSTAYPTGYTKIYKNGTYRMMDALANYSIVPFDGTANMTIGCGTTSLSSFFQGAIAKFTIWPYEPSAADIAARYKLIVPSPDGTSRFLTHVGDATSASSTTIIDVAVTQTIPAGSTLIAHTGQSYTSGAPTMGDSKLNTWTRDRTTADGGSTFRASAFSAPLNSDLVAGDIIRTTFSAAVTNGQVSIDAFSKLLFPSGPLDKINSASGSSVNPGLTLGSGVVTTQADELVVGTLIAKGPITDTYTEDTSGLYASLTRTGTNTGGALDVTVNSAYKVVNQTFGWTYKPGLGTSRSWLGILATYKAGTPTITPPVTGSATYVGEVGAATATTSGTTLVITLTDSVAVGHTLVCTVSEDYTTASPSCADTQGNSWSLIRTAADAGLTVRGAILAAPIQFAMTAGDTVTVTHGATLTGRAARLDDFANVAGPIVTDVQNGTSGNSTTPSTSVTTTHADDMLISAVAVAGPTADTVTPDITHGWTNTGRTGTNSLGGTSDKTINTQYRAVGATATYSIAPVLGTARPWVILEAALEAGTPISPPTPGTGTFVRNLASATATTSGTTLTLTVPTGGVPTNHTVTLRTVADYTSSVPTITDSRSNTWTLSKSAADTPTNTIRCNIHHCNPGTALQSGDTITITWPSTVVGRAATADELSGILTPVTVNASNSKTGSGTSVTATVTTTVNDEFIVAAVGVKGPTSESYSEDTVDHWTGLTRVGTTGIGGSGDRTLNAAYRSVVNTGGYVYAPTLGTPEAWVMALAAYRGG